MSRTDWWPGTALGRRPGPDGAGQAEELNGGEGGQSGREQPQQGGRLGQQGEEGAAGLPPLQAAGLQEEGLPQEENLVEGVRGEPVPLGLHDEAGSAEEPLHRSAGRGRGQVPGAECLDPTKMCFERRMEGWVDG